MKDNFSRQSADYAKYRPSYPNELFQFLNSLVEEHLYAWDCATGNGQVAIALTSYFQKVEATDLSEKQITNAVLHDKINYRQEQAEHTSFADQQFDLITVGQAIHWFNFVDFYAEAGRVLKPGGILAIFGYPIPLVDELFDKTFLHFYHVIIGPYWDAERHYIDEHYRSIPFPYQEIETPSFNSKYEWSFEQFLGFLSTWSGVAHYKAQTGNDPIALYKKELSSAWGSDPVKTITFEVFCKIGRK